VLPKPTHSVERHIHAGSHPPIFAKSRRLDPQKLEIAKAEFKSLESAGLIHRSNLPWASPLHMVPKKDESWPPCGDHRRLNLITTPDKYPLPNMQDLSNGLDSFAVFSKIYLFKGYHQIPVEPEDVPKTAIITPFGLFEYLFTPFGLSNAAQTFQRMMDRTCAGLEGAFPYMDDSQIASPDRDMHLQYFTSTAELSLGTDASDTHICDVFSRKLTDTESRYSTFDCELLAAQASIKHFRHFNKGCSFQLWTDHKPFVTAYISRVSVPISPRQQRHLALIQNLIYSFCVC
jgi:hypothetical protein